jgi:hypothetical protein
MQGVLPLKNSSRCRNTRADLQRHCRAISYSPLRLQSRQTQHAASERMTHKSVNGAPLQSPHDEAATRHAAANHHPRSACSPLYALGAKAPEPRRWATRPARGPLASLPPSAQPKASEVYRLHPVHETHPLPFADGRVSLIPRRPPFSTSDKLKPAERHRVANCFWADFSRSSAITLAPFSGAGESVGDEVVASARTDGRQSDAPWGQICNSVNDEELVVGPDGLSSCWVPWLHLSLLMVRASRRWAAGDTGRDGTFQQAVSPVVAAPGLQ